MFNKFKKYSPFGSKQGFTLFFLATSGFGLLLCSFYQNRRYDQPVVNEAMRILSQNDQMLKLTGYPLTIKKKMFGIAELKQDVCHFTFGVEGPKGNAQIRLLGQSRQLKEIPDKVAEFYIPSLEQMIDLQQESKTSEERLKDKKLKDDARFWKIDSLVAEVGIQGDYRIPIIEGNKILNKQIPLEPPRLMLRKPKVPQTDQEIEEARLYKQQELYRKIGSVRMVMLGGTLLLAMGLYNYVHANRKINIKNSQFHLQSLDIVRQNIYVRQLFGPNIQFNTHLVGDAARNNAQFSTEIYGKKYGIVSVKGSKESNQNEWNIDEIFVKVKDNEGNIIDEKKIYGN
ncbi:hypothetical protein pb186bvf_014341 [Paramecium bursaria]